MYQVIPIARVSPLLPIEKTRIVLFKYLYAIISLIIDSCLL